LARVVPVRGGKTLLDGVAVRRRGREKSGTDREKKRGKKKAESGSSFWKKIEKGFSRRKKKEKDPKKRDPQGKRGGGLCCEEGNS